MSDELYFVVVPKRLATNLHKSTDQNLGRSSLHHNSCLRHLRNLWLISLGPRQTKDRRTSIVNGALQFNIERSVIGLDFGGDGNVATVVRDPQCELTLFMIDQTIRSEKIWFNSKRIDASQYGLQLLLLKNPNRYPVNFAAISDEDFEALSQVQWLSSNEIDR